MIPQALEDLPGLTVERDGATLLNPEIWASRTAALNERLATAFRSGKDSPRRLKPLNHRRLPLRAGSFFVGAPGAGKKSRKSKSQSDDLSVGAPIDRRNLADKYPTSQARFPARSRALTCMTRRLQAAGSLRSFLDEPGLYAYSSANPRHWRRSKNSS